MEVAKIKDREVQEPVSSIKNVETAYEDRKVEKKRVKWPTKKKVAAEVLAVLLGSAVMFMLISAGDAVGLKLVQMVGKLI